MIYHSVPSFPSQELPRGYIQEKMPTRRWWDESDQLLEQTRTPAYPFVRQAEAALHKELRRVQKG